jgi:hypothetical protein
MLLAVVKCFGGKREYLARVSCLRIHRISLFMLMFYISGITKREIFAKDVIFISAGK